MGSGEQRWPFTRAAVPRVSTQVLFFLERSAGAFKCRQLRDLLCMKAFRAGEGECVCVCVRVGQVGLVLQRSHSNQPHQTWAWDAIRFVCGTLSGLLLLGGSAVVLLALQQGMLPQDGASANDVSRFIAAGK